jgi:N utilization substance protein B
MQVLFLWDANGQSDADLARSAMIGAEGTDIADEATIKLAMTMANGAWEHRQLSDDWLARLAPQWPPRRQPGVDRNILRLAVWEMTHAGTPPKVAIDEAVELAKRFSTENSPGFVNGLLDAVLREIKTLKGETAATPAAPASPTDERRNPNDERTSNDQ